MSFCMRRFGAFSKLGVDLRAFENTVFSFSVGEFFKNLVLSSSVRCGRIYVLCLARIKTSLAHQNTKHDFILYKV